MKIISVDPGLYGAVCYLDGHDLRFFDCPLQDSQKVLMGKNINAAALFNILSNLPRADVFVVEAIEARAKQGAVGTLKTGFGGGIYEGIAAALGYTPRYIRAADWKRKMGVTKDKKEAIKIACELLPDAVPFLSRVKDNGRAEALLMAIFAKKMGGEYGRL